MATNVSLRAQRRDGRGKGPARRMRREGRVPAVMYGHGDETRVLSVNAHELERLFAGISVENTLINVEIEGERAPIRALVRDVQRHPVRPEILHLDLYQIHADEPVDLEIPVRVTGTAAGVKAGGVLQQVLHELPVRCLPAAIPEAFEVDVSALEIGDSIQVGALAVPDGVTVEAPADRTIVSVVPPTVTTVEEEEEAATPEAAAEEVEPELIRKRPDEDEIPPATEQG